MDLKLREVAELLNVSEITIRRWLVDGKIPAYRINHQYRFSRVEIENWIISHRLAVTDAIEPVVKKETINKYNLLRAMNNGIILEKVPGHTKDDVIGNSAKKIGEHIKYDSGTLIDLLLTRESLQSTALNNGFAAPHTRNFLTSDHQDYVCVAFLDKPINYDSYDKIPVKTLFFLFASDEKKHLNLLSKIANLCNDVKNQEFINSHPSKSEFLDYVKAWEEKVY